MRSRHFVVVAAAAALLSASLAARADTYNYTVDYAYGPESATVSFDEPAILNAITTIQASSFLSSSVTGYGPGETITSVFIAPLSAEQCTGPVESCAILDGDPFPVGAVYFPNVDINTTGTFNGLYGSVTITDVSTVTPEPSSFVLLGSGLLGVVGVVRRRFV